MMHAAAVAAPARSSNVAAPAAVVVRPPAPSGVVKVAAEPIACGTPAVTKHLAGVPPTASAASRAGSPSFLRAPVAGVSAAPRLRQGVAVQPVSTTPVAAMAATPTAAVACDDGSGMHAILRQRSAVIVQRQPLPCGLPEGAHPMRAVSSSSSAPAQVLAAAPTPPVQGVIATTTWAPMVAPMTAGARQPTPLAAAQFRHPSPGPRQEPCSLPMEPVWTGYGDTPRPAVLRPSASDPVARSGIDGVAADGRSVWPSGGGALQASSTTMSQQELAAVRALDACQELAAVRALDACQTCPGDLRQMAADSAPEPASQVHIQTKMTPQAAAEFVSSVVLRQQQKMLLPPGSRGSSPSPTRAHEESSKLETSVDDEACHAGTTTTASSTGEGVTPTPPLAKMPVDKALKPERPKMRGAGESPIRNRAHSKAKASFTRPLPGPAEEEMPSPLPKQGSVLQQSGLSESTSASHSPTNGSMSFSSSAKGASKGKRQGAPLTPTIRQAQAAAAARVARRSSPGAGNASSSQPGKRPGTAAASQRPSPSFAGPTGARPNLSPSTASSLAAPGTSPRKQQPSPRGSTPVQTTPQRRRQECTRQIRADFEAWLDKYNEASLPQPPQVQPRVGRQVRQSSAPQRRTHSNDTPGRQRPTGRQAHTPTSQGAGSGKDMGRQATPQPRRPRSADRRPPLNQRADAQRRGAEQRSRSASRASSREPPSARRTTSPGAASELPERQVARWREGEVRPAPADDTAAAQEAPAAGLEAPAVRGVLESTSLAAEVATGEPPPPPHEDAHGLERDNEQKLRQLAHKQLDLRARLAQVERDRRLAYEEIKASFGPRIQQLLAERQQQVADFLRGNEGLEFLQDQIENLMASGEISQEQARQQVFNELVQDAEKHNHRLAAEEMANQLRQAEVDFYTKSMVLLQALEDIEVRARSTLEVLQSMSEGELLIRSSGFTVAFAAQVAADISASRASPTKEVEEAMEAINAEVVVAAAHERAGAAIREPPREADESSSPSHQGAMEGGLPQA
eukprot:TRINITY_DN13420_c0_g1_i1.p1 TRINITY_DN13420_c0_g1~~TRINITY_DN13420_c0_g1_i1.p1  ORF type:complete len:1025 (+),score=211.19 TRINITY_DN13420_c0_g1_i1:123-3197(+)